MISKPFTGMHINTGAALTNHYISSSNQLENDSSITLQDEANDLAYCITGLGPGGTNSNDALGGWYFNGNKLPDQVCSDNGVRVLDNIRAGVFLLQQCGLPIEGVYSCSILNNLMVQQLMVITLYHSSRSK